LEFLTLVQASPEWRSGREDLAHIGILPGQKAFSMGPGGKNPFDYEGAYATPTGPFSISGENVR